MWDELGIAPCENPKAIRRAYAARLKKLDPDRDPEAFARLRRAFEQALDGAGRDNSNRDSGPQSSDTSPPPAAANSNADPAETDLSSAAAPDGSAPAAADFGLQPPAGDHDDIRDRALLIALDAALRRRDTAEATILYYRAAATGALSLESAPDVVGRLLAVAVDDKTIGAAAFRRLARTVGLDTPQSRAPVASELRRRVLARLGAEDWYDDLLAKARQRKGRVARRQAKIARLLLGRIGRYWNRGVDKTALKSWLTQYKTHGAWLEDRIDPAWPRRLERRLDRRETFWLAFYCLFIGSLLIQAVLLFAVGLVEGDADIWAFMVGAPLVGFFAWIFVLLMKDLLRRLFPGWSAGIAPRARALWAGRGRAIWSRLKTKRHGDAG